MTAGNKFTGSGSLTGSANVSLVPSGGPTFTYSWALTTTSNWDSNGLYFSPPIAPTFPADSWSVGATKTATLSGLTGGQTIFNGTELVITRSQSNNFYFSQDSPTIDSVFALQDYLYNGVGFDGTITIDYPGITFNWN